MTPIEMLHGIAEEWFLREPAFYSLYCLQQLEENPRIECPIRVGEGRIEYNPLLLKHRNYRETEQLLRIEMIRLFLKHPYERRPEGCRGEVITLGSDCTIADGYCLLKEAGALKGPGAYHLPIGQCYEYYCKALQNRDESDNQPKPQPENQQQHNKSDASSDASSGSSAKSRTQQSELWHDDSLRKEQINQLIERTSDWGSLSGDIVEQIKASTRARLNISMLFQGFRSSLLSSHRLLTRMRPNRRTGFLQMGSRREVQARLLIAVDCSASIDEEALSAFFGIVRRLFVERSIEIDVLQFDADVLEVAPLVTFQSQVTVHGRGGTSYQPVIDYLLSHTRLYDGMMILTDGEAPPPVIPAAHPPLLWVCRNEEDYRQHSRWMRQSGRCGFIPNQPTGAQQ